MKLRRESEAGLGGHTGRPYTNNAGGISRPDRDISHGTAIFHRQRRFHVHRTSALRYFFILLATTSVNIAANWS